MAINYAKHYSTKQTPQSEPMPDSTQVPNSAGGYSFAIDKWSQLLRFLILGTEGGTYYINEKTLTRENAKSIEACLKEDGLRVVKTIVEVSDSGRAPKNDPAVFALAMAAKLGDAGTKKAAREALPKVCRTGTHLFHFGRALESFGGWGRGTRDAVASWYTRLPIDKLAYQAVKYQSRDGWGHRDLLRLSHPKTEDALRNSIFRWMVKGAEGLDEKLADPDKKLQMIWAFEAAKKADKKTVIKLIRDHGLPREGIPTQFLTEADVWAALLESMPVHAMIRNLGNMSKCGLLTQTSDAASKIVKVLGDKEALKKSRLHPIAILTALLTYRAGHGTRGHGQWTPAMKVCDALDKAFYLAFGNVESTGKRWMLALDISGSMSSGEVAGVQGLTPRVASAALAMVTAAVEPDHIFTAFETQMTEFLVSPKDRLDTVCRRTEQMHMGGTDCAQPMLYAMQRKMPIDVFVILTDSETWAGTIHPPQALKQYRDKLGIPAKVVVVGMTSNGFTIADPRDAGMLDVVGFDAAVPQMMSDFALDWKRLAKSDN